MAVCIEYEEAFSPNASGQASSKPLQYALNTSSENDRLSDTIFASLELIIVFKYLVIAKFPTFGDLMPFSFGNLILLYQTLS